MTNSFSTTNLHVHFHNLHTLDLYIHVLYDLSITYPSRPHTQISLFHNSIKIVNSDDSKRQRDRQMVKRIKPVIRCVDTV